MEEELKEKDRQLLDLLAKHQEVNKTKSSAPTQE